VKTRKERTGGQLQVGHLAKIAVQAEEGGFVLRPVVILREYTENKGLAWSSRPGFFQQYFVDGYHYFFLERVDSHTTRLIHGEHFTGILVFLLKFIFLFIVLRKARYGFRRFNEAFKAKVETKQKEKNKLCT